MNTLALTPPLHLRLRSANFRSPAWRHPFEADGDYLVRQPMLEPRAFEPLIGPPPHTGRFRLGYGQATPSLNSLRTRWRRYLRRAESCVWSIDTENGSRAERRVEQRKELRALISENIMRNFLGH